MGTTEALAIAICLLSAIWAPPRRDTAACPKVTAADKVSNCTVHVPQTSYGVPLVCVALLAALLLAVTCKLYCDRRRVAVGRPVARAQVRPVPTPRRRDAGPLGHLSVSAHLL